MADDKVRGAFYDKETKKIVFWDGKEYSEILNFPDPPETGTHTLKIIDGVLTWVED